MSADTLDDAVNLRGVPDFVRYSIPYYGVYAFGHDAVTGEGLFDRSPSEAEKMADKRKAQLAAEARAKEAAAQRSATVGQRVGRGSLFSSRGGTGLGTPGSVGPTTNLSGRNSLFGN